MPFNPFSTLLQNNRSKRRRVLFGCILAASVLLVVCLIWLKVRPDTTPVPFIDENLLSSLPSKDASNIDMSHLAPGVTPPTNKWFSGLALQKVPKTVFPTPLALTPSESSFSFSLPVVKTTANTLFNTQPQPVTVMIKSATRYRITRYDELSVDLSYSNGDKPLGVLTITAGSPYIYFHALQSTQLTATGAGGTVTTSETTGSIVGNQGKTKVAGFNGVSITHDTTSLTATLPGDGLVSLYALPASMTSDPLLTSAGNRITETSVSYKKETSDYRTSIHLVTANGQPSYLGLLPHQTNPVHESFSYDTLYGKQRQVKGSDITFTTPSIPVSDSLKLTNLNEADKALLATTLRRDINATTFVAEDTYFGGKELYRSAQLLTLAKQLGEDTIADTIQQKLRHELNTWFMSTDNRTKKDFYYDTKIQGLVGETVAFGSEEFNDHHFHYGYIIYAASILAKYDTDFLTQYKPMVDLLVADIANYRDDEKLPLRRNFDPYFGHSWASGSAPFNDGNNQESSSEAINAWVATSLWAQQTGNSELLTESGWMLSNEVEATNAYWLNFDPNTAPYKDGYTHSLVSLNWGGKRDYTTFFSAEPSAMLGILLIPMNPTAVYQTSLGDRISQQVDEAITGSNYDVQFGDFILMYKALHNKADTLDKAKVFPDTLIDGANSRSYMYAWIMSQK
ncbi:MAG: Endo,3(4)-beta-glucanase [Candidatus Saccharibacteria bacterium]|nr:Endo,3(4)-beta-glucanase [Candidatus Saccharibacteria bacterium]